MTAVRKNPPKAQRESMHVPWALLGAVIMGGLAILIIYIIFFAPETGPMANARNVMKGLGGDLFVLFPLIAVWLCVLCAFSAAGRKVSVWRLAANFLLFFCVLSTVELFFLAGVKSSNTVILSWADFIAKSYRYSRGGGALGALFAAAIYDYLGEWGGLIAILILATLLLTATGRISKLAAFIKKGSHDVEQKRLQRRSDTMFDADEDTLLDNAFGAPPKQRKPAPRQRLKFYNESVPEEPAKVVKSIDTPAEKFVSKPSKVQKQEIKETEAVKVEDFHIEPDEYEINDIPAPEPAKAAPLPKLKREPVSEPVENDDIYNYPPIDLLTPGAETETVADNDADIKKAKQLEETLRSFGIQTKLTGIAHGPAVTRFELQPAPGVKVSRITALADDIALNLAAIRVRIEAPIPGKAAVGVEVPNDKVENVPLRDVLESPDARKHTSRVAVGLGKDNSGRYIVADIAKMPHVLIAGQTGSGKSVCINSIIVSILYRATPDEVKLILIDPKVVELSVYNGIPHLIAPVVTDPKKASSALDWAVAEMTSRYKKFAERGVRDIKGYNKDLHEGEKQMPHMVIIIDELADLMMVSPGEVEDSICRLAQLARAAGMHLVIATQRPSVNVITGIIKANIPTRIAFLVASQVDSRTIIDHGGAEKLLGYGDMLFVPSGIQKPMRVQGAWVSDEEVHSIVEFIKERHESDYDEDVLEHINNSVLSGAEKEEVNDEYDPRLPEAIEIVLEAGQASISMLQRRMRVGYARAGRLIDDMYQRGIVSEADGAKPRTVLLSREQVDRLFAD